MLTGTTLLPPRNHACWCDSGKKYKRCHRRADEASRVLDQRYGPLSCALIEVASPFLDGFSATDLDLDAIARMTRKAWSISRLPEAVWEPMIRDITGPLEGPAIALAAMLQLLCERARSLYPDDPRMVIRAWFTHSGEARVLCATGTLE